MIASAAGARRALATECRLQNADCRMQNGGEEDLLEPIDPDGRLVRVNLRPFVRAAEVRRHRAESRRQKYGLDWLAEVMVESARRVKGDPELMKRRLEAAISWFRNSLPAEAAALERLSAQAELSGYPAFHHSRTYARAYRPSYRVVLSGCLKRRASRRAG